MKRKMKQLGAPTKTSVIYIGEKRYQQLSLHAREISYMANTNITPSNFLHYIIDEYIKNGRESLLSDLKKIIPPEDPGAL